MASSDNTLRQKRFLFFTGGTDSTLLLHFLLELLQKRINDELVIVIVANENLTSGQEEKVIESIKYLVSNILNETMPSRRDMLDRISLAITTQGMHQTTPYSMAFVKDDGFKDSIVVNSASCDPEVIKNMSCLVMQELSLISALPMLTTYLGACKNTFYIGACGTDIATQGADKLIQFFNLFYDISMLQSHSSSLQKELAAQGIDNFNRTGDKQFKAEWIPTLEMPLRYMRKQDVVLALTGLKNTSHQVDKPENLVEHYSMSGDQMVYLYTNIYHKVLMENHYPANFPSLFQFIQDGSLTFGDLTLSKNDVSELVRNEKICLMIRSGVPKEIAPLMVDALKYQ